MHSRPGSWPRRRRDGSSVSNRVWRRRADGSGTSRDQRSVTRGMGKVESNFQNVGTANGSTSANGFWQITTPTWNGTVARDGLCTPRSQQSGGIRRQFVPTSSETPRSRSPTRRGNPRTTLQVYGGYLFGPSYAGALATEAESTPLSAIIPAASVANNGMQNLTMGDFRSRFSNKLGSAANQPVLAGV